MVAGLKRQMPDVMEPISEGYFAEVVQPWVGAILSCFDVSPQMQGTGEHSLEVGQTFLAEKLSDLEQRTGNLWGQVQTWKQANGQEVQGMGAKLRCELLETLEKMVEVRF